MLKKLYVELASSCNLNCKMCFRHSWFDEECGTMSDATLCRLLEEIPCSSANTVFLGGMGEPLLHPRLCQVIGAAHDSGKNVELITNATMLDRKMAESLVQAGLDMLWVSMDGFSQESYEEIRRGSLYNLIMKNLSTFNSVRGAAKLGITFVMMKENEYELENINDFADKIGADVINLSHVIPSSPLKEEESLYNKTYTTGKMHRFTKDDYKKPTEKCPFVEDGCCFIKWNGDVTACMQLLHSSYSYLYEEKRKIYAKSFGNIAKESLGEIWNSQEYKSFRQKVHDFDFPCCFSCLGCDMRLENREDCLYNEMPTCGACLWAQGLVRCP